MGGSGATLRVWGGLGLGLMRGGGAVPPGGIALGGGGGG